MGVCRNLTGLPLTSTEKNKEVCAERISFFPPLESLFMLFHCALCPRKLALMDSIKGLAPPLTTDLVRTKDPQASGWREENEVVNSVP